MPCVCLGSVPIGLGFGYARGHDAWLGVVGWFGAGWMARGLRWFDALEYVRHGRHELLRVRSKEEAIACCDQFAAVLGDVELFMGPVVEPWDLGMMPKPDNAPLRFLSMHQLHESGAPDTPPDQSSWRRWARSSKS